MNRRPSETRPVPAATLAPHPDNFAENFRRLFVRGLVAVMPTLITLWLLLWVWNFLWQNLGEYILTALSNLIWVASKPVSPISQNAFLKSWLLSHNVPYFIIQLIGVVLAIIAIYLIGLIAGGFTGKVFYRVGENLVMRVPLIRAIYPAVKQITDFVLAQKQEAQFTGSRVVAVKNHSSGIWSIGLYTGAAIPGIPGTPAPDAAPQAAGEGDMVTVFIPSTPTAFTGYVVVVRRCDIVELPLTVEEAMRLLVSGGVVSPLAAGHGSLPAPSSEV